jgi:molybdopterin synthase sulfur carrier subunit
MEWRLFATLSEAAGTDTVALDIGGEATLREAFDALLETQPDLEAEVLDDDGTLYDHVRLLADGSNPFARGNGWETTVNGGTELALFPPVSGG